jgi:(S)-3,5-dihydroxyphenylglycine transaminase
MNSVNAAIHDPLLERMNFLNEITHRYPNAISFGPGRPSERSFDVQRSLDFVGRYVESVAKEGKETSTEVWARIGQYGPTAGIIQDAVARYLTNDERIEVSPASIVITTGAQEAMTLLLIALFQPNDVLLVSDPSYIGMRGMAQLLRIPVELVPSSREGLTAEAVRAAIARVRASGRRPRALYDIPDFHNPLGTQMPVQTRQALLKLAEAEDFLILEDNPYGAFSFDGARLPTLKALDTSARVVYIGTFSKSIFPGTRMGFLVADQAQGQLASDLSKVKSYVTVNTSPLLQALVGGLLLENNFSLRARTAPMVALYRANRDAMVASLEGHVRRLGLEGQVLWNRPAGGFFLRLEIPAPFNEREMNLCASEYGVICCPMSFFSDAPSAGTQVRLSFSYVTAQEIDEGVGRLCRFFKERLLPGSAP